ncbi:hypothetical protein K9L27_03295 [Candidatus Gracilibacteria bacterium]|nr:hypothetical protein [Candidatus Gracilibacteria bacterium]
MKFFILLLASLFCGWNTLPSSPSYHASAAQYHSWSRSSRTTTIQPNNKISIALPWDGHFSATHFRQDPTDTLALKKIREDLRKAIVGLPPLHTAQLKNIEIRNQTNVSRGMANSQTLILHSASIETSDELISVFVHEMGHIVDLGVLKSLNGGATEFRDGNTPIFEDDKSVDFYRISWAGATATKPESQRKDFVSGYSMTNCFEDFSESYVFYRLHGEKFRALSEKSEALNQKYNFFKEVVFEGAEFQIGTPLVAGFDANIWDATRLNISQGDLLVIK